MVKAVFNEPWKASPNDPYDKKLQIELFKSSIYPESVQNYFKLRDHLGDNYNDEKSEKIVLYSESL